MLVVGDLILCSHGSFALKVLGADGCGCFHGDCSSNEVLVGFLALGDGLGSLSAVMVRVSGQVVAHGKDGLVLNLPVVAEPDWCTLDDGVGGWKTAWCGGWGFDTGFMAKAEVVVEVEVDALKTS